MISALLSKPRRLIATLALVLTAAGVAVGSGATFSSTSANPSNTFSSGTLTQSNSKAGAAIFTGSNLKPGDSTVGTVTITNTGSLAGGFKLVESGYSSTFSSASMTTLKIEDVTNASAPTTIYTGNVGSVGTIDLGTFAAGAARTYKYTVTLDSSADNTNQGKTVGATYTWNSTQA